MATWKGLEPSTSSVTGWHSNQLNYQAAFNGGTNRARTCDPLLVRQVLSQLSYGPENYFKLERVKGIEPSQPAWKAGTLPLSYTRMVTHRGIEPLLPPWKGGVLTAWPMSHFMELVIGLEPTTCWLQVSCSTNWAIPAYYVATCYSPRRSPTKYHCR